MTRRRLLGVCYAALAAMTAFHPSAARAATQLFRWDCEAGTLDNYFNYNVQQASTLSTVQSHSGSKSILWDGNVNTNGGLSVRSPAAFTGTGSNGVHWVNHQPEIYLRWWMWVPSSLEGGASGHHGWRLYNSTGSNFMEIDTVAGNKTDDVGVGWGFALFDYTSAPHVDDGTHYNIWQYPFGRWFQFSFYTKLNTPGVSDGTATVWIDGAQVYTSTTVKYRGSGSENDGWDKFDLSTNWDGGGTDNYWYIDDLEIWDGIPPSGAAPAPPTNLRVQ